MYIKGDEMILTLVVLTIIALIDFFVIIIMEPRSGVIVAKQYFDGDYIFLVRGNFDFIGVVGVNKDTYKKYKLGDKYP